MFQNYFDELVLHNKKCAKPAIYFLKLFIYLQGKIMIPSRYCMYILYLLNLVPLLTECHSHLSRALKGKNIKDCHPWISTTHSFTTMQHLFNYYQTILHCSRSQTRNMCILLFAFACHSLQVPWFFVPPPNKCCPQICSTPETLKIKSTVVLNQVNTVWHTNTYNDQPHILEDHNLTVHALCMRV